MFSETTSPQTAGVTLPISESNVTNLVSDLAAKAALASPALTGTPTTPTASANDSSIQIANTSFVAAAITAAINDTEIKVSVRAASQGNLLFTRSGNVYTANSLGVLLKVTIDSGWASGAVLAVGDRILLANQTSNVDNGIVTITVLGTIGLAAVLTRATDMDADAEVISEMEIPVSEGTDANINYKLSSAGPFTLNSTALPFTRAGGPPTGSAGGDLTGTYPNPTIKTSPTIVTPTIASFVNSTHNHQNAAGGGTLDATLALGSTIVPIANGGTGTNDLRIIYNIRMNNGNQSTSSSSAGNINDLVYATAINRVYKVRFYFVTSCNNTGGIKVGCDIPTAATMYISLDGTTTANTATISNALNADATLNASAYNTESQTRHISGGGTITTGANSGNIQFQFAAGVNGQTVTILKEGTWLEITDIT